MAMTSESTLLKSSVRILPDVAIGSRVRYVVQLLVTLCILGCPIPSWATTILLLGWWGVSFGAIRPRELTLYAGLCVFFSFMNYQSLKNGIFAFSEPVLLGMPWYEFFMWGFYALNAKRLIGYKQVERPTPILWFLLFVQAAAFALISDHQALLGVSAAILFWGLYQFHSRADLMYVGYMVLLGAAVEYVGVWAGQWTYPLPPVGGVPLWFITMWGSVGFFLHRLILPCVYPRGCK